MGNKTNIKSIYSLILALVFMSPQLMMPLHFAFAHHEQHNHTDNSKPQISAIEKECAICDFHFFHFISSVALYDASIIVKHTYKAVSLIVNEAIAGKAILQNAGRAPPLHTNIYHFII